MYIMEPIKFKISNDIYVNHRTESIAYYTTRDGSLMGEENKEGGSGGHSISRY